MSLSYKANKLRETWTGVAQGFVDRGDLGKIIDALTKLSEAVEFVTSKLGLLKTLAVGVTAALSFKNVGRDKMYSPLVLNMPTTYIIYFGYKGLERVSREIHDGK